MSVAVAAHSQTSLRSVATPTTCARTAADSDDTSVRLVNRLKNTDLAKFHTLCKMHLSFLLDLPGSRLDELLGGTGGADGTPACGTEKARLHFPHFGKRKCSKEVRSCGSSAGGMNDMLEQILPLIQFLGRPENLCEEGLFRKSGHMGRQRTLREVLASGGHLVAEVAKGVYSAHDCAALLKSILGEMCEPLLTERHYCAHCQVPDMQSAEKRLQAVQLLLQLVPRDRHVALDRLLALLHNVAREPTSKMTAETLGTLFAPHILVPRKMAPSELQAVASSITRAVAFMIEMAPRLFEIPEPLVRDIAKYWQEMEEETDSVSLGSASSQNDLDIINGRAKKCESYCDPVINTTVAFADHLASQRAAAQTDTQVALAQLYAHVSAMPESGRKRKLLKQFNKANAACTPANSDASCEPKHKRSRSLSESIKKMVNRGSHKRRGSGCTQGALVSPANGVTVGHTHGYVPPVSSHASPAMSTHPVSSTHQPYPHTPLIRRPVSSMTPIAVTPVMRLFKADLHKPALLLPSSPRVHIVDMQQRHVGVSRHASHAAHHGAMPQLTAFRCHSKVMDENQVPPVTRHTGIEAFVSPMSRSMKRMSPSLLSSVLTTPGSRVPMAVIQTP